MSYNSKIASGIVTNPVASSSNCWDCTGGCRGTCTGSCVGECVNSCHSYCELNCAGMGGDTRIVPEVKL